MWPFYNTSLHLRCSNAGFSIKYWMTITGFYSFFDKGQKKKSLKILTHMVFSNNFIFDQDFL